MPELTAARRWPRRVAVGVVVVVILAIGIPFTYIHFIEGKAPAKLALTPAAPASAAGATSEGSTGALSGPWSVASGSIVGYRVSETLVGQKNTAVGRTNSVTGTVDISGTTVRSATFTAQMATVRSDESERDAQFDGRIMDVARYPTATFTLTSPIALGTPPTVGTTRSYPATGNLTMHGQTHRVTFTINAERTARALEVQGDIAVAFATWGIANPSFGSFVSTADQGTLEFLLHLQRTASSTAVTTTPTSTASPTSTATTPGGGGAGGPGSGSPPAGGQGGSPGQGDGGPGITVPATTTSPLTIGG